MKNKDILLKLLELDSDNLIHKRFDFSTFNGGDADESTNYCGTSGCLAGELPQFNTDWRFDEQGFLVYQNDVTGTYTSLGLFFDLPFNVIRLLFMPKYFTIINEHLYFSPDDNATLKEVQEHIKSIVSQLPELFEDEK